MNKKHIKIFLLVLTAAFASTFLSACGPTETQLNAYDNDSIIANRDTSYMVKNVSSTTTNESKYDFEYFCGVRTIFTVNMDGEKSFVIDLEITSPKFKFVLVKGDEVIVLCDETTDGTITVTKEELLAQTEKDGIEGDYKLKMVGRAAKAKFDIKY